MAKLLETQHLESELQKFADDRSWNQYHSPKNLVMALVGEAGELTEIFQWLTEEQSKAVMLDMSAAKQVKEEIADVMIYLVRLASVLKIDLNKAVIEKLVLNTQKYPVA